MITQEQVRQALRYDAPTGRFYWLRPASRAVKVGQLAGRVTNNGYRQIMVNGIRYQAHRLVWLLHAGVFPPQELDHINGVRDDNRIENLRLASKAENQQNIGACRAHSSCGLLGVSYHAGNRWRAQIGVNGKKYYLGLFPSPEEAHAAYLTAKSEKHLFQPTIRKGAKR